MKLWKVDSTTWTVRAVEGEPWPGTDSEGDTCYSNTLVTDEDKAWELLERDVKAAVSLAGDGVLRAEQALDAARVRAGTYAKAFAQVQAALRRRAHATAGADTDTPSVIDAAHADRPQAET